MVTLIAKVVAYDYADVLELKALRCVDAPRLVDGRWTKRERLSPIQVPAYLKVSYCDLMGVCIGATRARPVPAVSRQNARLI